MQKPTLDIDIKLVVETPNNIIITDNTNYTTLGLNPNDVFMTVQIITPIGLLYSPSYFNTPNISNDLTPSSPFEYKDVDDAIVKFLQDSHSCFINGIYKVNIKWYYVGTGETFEYTLEKDIKLVLPKIKIKQYADCFCAKFRSTDITSYGESVKVDYEHIINYPSETNTPDIETGLSDYTDEQLANGTYVSQISTTRDFNFGTFDVRYTLVGRESFVVDCASLCDVKCGINNLYKKYQEACGKDKHESERLLKMLNKVTLLYTIMTLNNACGTSENSESYISKIKDIIGDCDCGCTGCGEDIWVTGVCGSTGGSEFDPTPIYNYINYIRTNITNNLDSINTDITNLETLYNTLLNQSWFAGLVTTCLVGFPTGTDTQKKQYIIDLLCELKTAIQSPPEAHDDYSTIQENTTVEKLVTLNDFFTTDVVVTIVTNGTNGVATVLADGKTLKYIPNTNWFGNDTITYKITDANAQESTAVWHITVTAVPAVSCSTVTPNYNADAYSVGSNLQIAITNLSDIGANVLTGETYIIAIRNSSNVILHSYTVTGTMTSAPTIWTSPIPIANDWDNFTIEQSITTQSSTGALCGTVTFEREDPFSLNDVAISWFDGTVIPACIPILPTDTEIEKKQKMLNAICNGGYSINGILGSGKPNDKYKLGGQLSEDTTINGDNNSFSLVDLSFMSLSSGGATSIGVGTKNESSHILHNYNFPLGYAVNYKKSESHISGLSLTDGHGISNESTHHDIVLGSNITTLQLGKGSAIVNGLHVMSFDVEGADFSLSQDQSSGAFPKRMPANQIFAVNVSPTGLTYKATVDKMANIVISTFSGSFNNKFNEYIQLFVRNAKGSGSVVASLLDMPNTYGIYQEGSDDKNVFYGEIQYHGGLVNASDIRSKDIKGDFLFGLEDILKISPIIFTRKDGFGDTNKEQVGVIAQDLEDIIPSAISTSRVENNNGDVIDDFKMVNSDYVLYSLVNAVKELSAKVDILQTELDALKQ